MRIGLIFAAVLAVAVGTLRGEGEDLKPLWAEYKAAVEKNLPRTETNVLTRIEREAVAAGSLPDAVKAFIARVNAERRLDDRLKDEWLPALERRVASAPAKLRPYLDLYLANVIRSEEDEERWDRTRTKLANEVPPYEKIFERVLGHADELKAEPVTKWTNVLECATMPDSCRPTLYDLAIHDIIGFYGSTVPDKTLEKGLQLFDALIDFHRLDANADALADATLARIEYEIGFSELPEAERRNRLARAYDKLIAEFGGRSSVALLALSRRAHLEYARGNRVAAWQMALKGVEMDEKDAKGDPVSVGGKNCRHLAEGIAAPNAFFTVEELWTDPFAPIKVAFENVKEVHFKLVPIARDVLLGHKTDRKALRKIAAQPGAYSWKAMLPAADDFCEHEQEVAPPSEIKPGAYVFFAGLDDAFNDKGLPYFAKVVQVSDLMLVCGTDAGGISGTVFKANPGTRVRGATVELWSTETKVATAITDENGAFAFAAADRELRLRVVNGTSELVSPGALWLQERQKDDERCCERVSVVTDRAIYRPGQKIHFKGYASFVDPEKREFRVLPGARVELDLQNPDGKVVGGWMATANAWGTFVGAFEAPRDGMTGSYSIQAKIRGSKASGYTEVEVEEYKRSKFEVKIGKPSSDAVLGKELELVGTAKTFAGVSVPNAKVSWRVERSTAFADWFDRGDKWCFNGGDAIASGTVETDEKGVFRIRFTPIADPKADWTGEPRFSFTVTADVTDLTGETRSDEASVLIGAVAWRSEIRVANGQEGGHPIATTVTLDSLDGTKVATAKGVLRCFRLKEGKSVVREDDWTKWSNGVEAVTREIEIKDGAWTGEVILDAGAYRFEFETRDPSGRCVRGKTTVAVVDSAGRRLGFAAPDYFAATPADESAISVGSTVRITWASGYATGCGRVEIYSNGKRVFRRDSDFGEPFVRVDYTVREADRGALECRTMFVREGKLYTHRQFWRVSWDSKALKIEREHFTSELETGKAETWTFKVSGESEVLALMYDRSLDEFCMGHRFCPPFGWFSARVEYVPLAMLVGGTASLYSPTGGKYPEIFGGVIGRWRSLASLFGGGYGMERMKCGAAAQSEGGFGDSCASCEMKCVGAADGKMTLVEADEFGAAPPSRPKVKVRKNLEETAFFLPQLTTDRDGRVSFTFTAPEAITGWKLMMLAHDKSLNWGVLTDESVTTTRPLMVEPNPPRFVREGDAFKFAVKVTNLSESNEACTVSLAFGGTVAEKKVALKSHEIATVEFPVAVADGETRVTYVAKAVGTDFADAEEGSLQVLSRQVEVREAVQLNLRGAGEKRFALTNLLESVKNGNTIRNVDLTARVVSRPAWYAVEALPYLMEFPHECCEQTFSRYYANALAAHLAKSDRRIGAVYDAERLKGAQEKCLAKLDAAQTDDGLYPWFVGGSGDMSISLYILIGFERLRARTGLEVPAGADRVREALDERVLEQVAWRQTECRRTKREFYLTDFDVRWLYLHSFREDLADDAKAAKPLIDTLEKTWTAFGIETQARAAVALHRMGRKGTAADILKSLRERAVRSEEFGLYYRREGFFCDVFGSAVMMQVAVIEAFQEVANDWATVDELRVWLLKQKQTTAWSSTVSTVEAIYALLAGGGTDLLAGDALATVTLGGTEAPKTNAVQGAGTCSASWRGAEVKPEMGEIVLKSAQPEGIVWGGVNWTYLEDVAKVRSSEPKELRIEKRYFRKVRTKDGARLEPVVGALRQGDELVARLKIRSDRVLEYVHVQDERPSCAEPVDVLTSYQWQDGVGYCQSTRDTATHYYIDRLEKGEFVLETTYRVQQRGTFTGGLAQIRCMYAPEFTAHSTSEPVEVGL